MQKSIPIFMVAQGGGPCSGKTTGMVHVAEYAQQLGLNVVLVPEAATEAFTAGVPRDPDTQANILDLQIAHEDAYYGSAQRLYLRYKKPVLVYCDRGILDGAAYAENQLQFDKLLLERKINRSAVLESRYDVVTHLVTAANGVPEFYTLANNNKRTETIEEAIVLDQKLQNVWNGAQHYEIIGNIRKDGTKKTFEEKLRENATAIFEAIGFPAPVEKERKWEVEKIELREVFEKNHIEWNECLIYQTYLVSKTDAEERIRRKVFSDGMTFCYHTYKRDVTEIQRIENERFITAYAYGTLMHRRDLSRKTIRKNRLAFIYKEQVFTVDEYLFPERKYHKLELEGSRIDSVILPDFLPIKKEVTGILDFKDSQLALV
jgi:SHS2 domain-containing protein